jgi:lipoprotein-anchoring transpeptidase ErfK/SrfK
MQLMTDTLSRRGFLIGSLAATSTLASCATSTQADARRDEFAAPAALPAQSGADAELDAPYATFEDGGHLVAAVPYRQIDPKFYRQRIPNPTGEAAGTVVVDTPSRFLYLVEQDGTAIRYGVGIGRDGFAWQGRGTIHWRQHWPRWKPPAEMIARQPELEKYSVAN